MSELTDTLDVVDMTTAEAEAVTAEIRAGLGWYGRKSPSPTNGGRGWPWDTTPGTTTAPASSGPHVSASPGRAPRSDVVAP